MDEQQLEASFSTLIISIASSAVMNMGLAEDPRSQKLEKNLKMAQFNIDLLEVLRDKTKNNLSDDEQKFLDTVVSDLQMKFVQVK